MPGLIYVSCALCGRREAALVSVQSGWRMVRCLACGLAYVSPRPTKASLRLHYQTYRP
ncbi:MAG: hypothetical protein HYR98_07015, partial [Nitrospirae bacterium]|nr:hypothetical protein [Nitrospirota bacterium]